VPNVSEVFLRATRVIPAKAVADQPAGDTISLTWDERHRRRIRMRTTGGTEFLLDLAHAVALADGDHLVLDDGTEVRVQARAETVADIVAADGETLTRIAWHLGNRHWPTQVLGDTLRIRYDHVLVEMIAGLGGRVERREAPFQPEGGAYAHEH